MGEKEIKWRKKAAKEDIKAALDELALSFSEKEVRKSKKEMLKRRADVETFKARDILRVAKLKPPSRTNALIQKQMKKISSGEKLCPVILVQSHRGLQIADGFHRIASLFYLDKDAEARCVRIEL